MEHENICRAKRKDDGEWIEGYYCRFGYTGEEKDYIIPSYASALYAIEVDPSTVGRFTGLTDKNGTRIFEGDIVYIARDDERGIVSWDDDGACFEVVIDNISTTFRDSWYGHDLEVIGNIHDNLELMGGNSNETDPV